NGIKFEYEFECRLLDTVIESKVSSKNKVVGDARKTVFSFNTPSASSKVSKQLEEGDSGATNTPKASSAQQVVKAGKTLKGRGRGRGRKPKKVRRNTRLEKEEEDVYSDSEEDDNSTDDIPTPRKPLARKAKKSESSDSIGEDQMEDQEVAEEDKDGLDEKSEISVGSRSSGKSRLHCDICFTVVLNAKAYESHIKRHTVTPGAGFQCRICRQAYENKEDFMRHKAKHDDGTFLCPVCKAGYEVESKIIQHVQTAHKDFWNRQPQKLLPVGAPEKYASRVLQQPPNHYWQRLVKKQKQGFIAGTSGDVVITLSTTITRITDNI
ncbi:unnamed protein product, partial [Allacma fusca]